MSAFALSTLVQIVLIIHVLRTGRDRIWIWVLIFLPLIGGAAYLVMELIPEWRGTVRGQKTLRQVKSTLNPGADTRHWANAWEQSPNAENARHYAAALIEANQHDEALTVLAKAMGGLFQHEPNLMLLKAQAEFAQEHFNEANTTLSALVSENPDFKSAEGHLLFARTLEQLGETERSLEEYQAVSHYYPGAEARFRYCAALQTANHREQAQTEVERMLKDAKLAPAHFRKSQREWLKAAAKLAQELSQADAS